MMSLLRFVGPKRKERDDDLPPATANERSARELTPNSRAVVLEQQLRPTDQFVDLGCGRGHVVADALDLGCTECVGVDNNPGVTEMLLNTVRSRGWTILEGSGEGVDTSYRIMKRHRKATVRVVIGDLETMASVPRPRRVEGGWAAWRAKLGVYWFGTIMPPRVKRNVCRRLLNALPNTTRVAYVHLPFGQLEDLDAKGRDPLFRYGLSREFRLLRRTSTSRADYLLTERGSQGYVAHEEAASFLYVKSDPSFGSNQSCAERQAARDAARARKADVYQERERAALVVLDAVKESSALAVEMRKGQLSAADFQGSPAPSDAAEGGGELLCSSDEDTGQMESDDDSDGSSRYASDGEPPDEDLDVQTEYRRMLRDHTRSVRNLPTTAEEPPKDNSPPRHGLETVDANIGGHRCWWCEQPAALPLIDGKHCCGCVRSAPPARRRYELSSQPFTEPIPVVAPRSAGGFTYASLVWEPKSKTDPTLQPNLWFVPGRLGVKQYDPSTRPLWRLLSV